MENTIDSFVGRWKIIEWQPGTRSLLEDHLQKDDHVLISEDSKAKDCCRLRWSSRARECSVNRPLAYVKGELRAYNDPAVSVGPDAAPIRLAGVTVWLADSRPRLRVRFDKSAIGDGNVGTVIAEADPGEPPVRRWLRWLGSLFHRR
jgi:hypothetical protein